MISRQRVKIISALFTSYVLAFQIQLVEGGICLQSAKFRNTLHAEVVLSFCTVMYLIFLTNVLLLICLQLLWSGKLITSTFLFTVYSGRKCSKNQKQIHTYLRLQVVSVDIPYSKVSYWALYDNAYACKCLLPAVYILQVWVVEQMWNSPSTPNICWLLLT